MTGDLDSLLHAVDPARDSGSDPEGEAALLARVRERVDHERFAVTSSGRRHSPWPRRLALISAAAAVLTAVPVAISALGGDQDGAPSVLSVAAAVGTDGSAAGQITCAGGEVALVQPEDAAVRLLPEQLPSGWSYTTIRARHFPSIDTCIPPSLVALRQDVDGHVTARIAITGPVDARVDQGKLIDKSVPDTLFGHEARRFDVKRSDISLRRWVWTDATGQQWSAEASGMPLVEARQALTAVSIDDTQLSWNASAAPGWTLAQQRTGAPDNTPLGAVSWWIQLTDGAHVRLLNIDVADRAVVPLQAMADVGDQITTVDGHPAIIERPRGGEAGGGAPGSQPETPVLVEVTPGTVASSSSLGGDLTAVEDMLGSLRQVAPDDSRLQQYDTD